MTGSSSETESGERIRQTVLFAEDQRELLGERKCVYKSLNPGCVSLPLLLVRRPCVYMSVFVFVPRSPEGSNKLR